MGRLSVLSSTTLSSRPDGFHWPEPAPPGPPAVLPQLGLPAARVMMVGDRLETDILMGQQAGMVTAVTLTGVATRADVAQMAQPPDYIINNLGELPDLVV